MTGRLESHLRSQRDAGRKLLVPYITGGITADWVDLLARLTDGFVRAIPPGGSPAAAALPGAPPGVRVPSIEGFARCAGLPVSLSEEHVYEVIVVGAGPAGLAASVYAA